MQGQNQLMVYSADAWAAGCRLSSANKQLDHRHTAERDTACSKIHKSHQSVLCHAGLCIALPWSSTKALYRSIPESLSLSLSLTQTRVQNHSKLEACLMTRCRTGQ